MFNGRPMPPRLPVAEPKGNGCMPVLLIGVLVVISATVAMSWFG